MANRAILRTIVAAEADAAIDFNDVITSEMVAYQDWDSGGPGAGAGRVSVHLRRGEFFVVNDAGLDAQYATEEEAIAGSGVNVISDATVKIWTRQAGTTFERSS